MDPIPPIKVIQQVQRRGKTWVVAEGLRFSLKFLACAGAVLLLYRASILTVPNQFYLFSIATTTNVVLRVVGIYSTVENSSAYAGREQELRRLLREAYALPYSPVELDILGRQKPLTAWEIHQFRFFRLLRQIREVTVFEETLKKPFQSVVVHSPAEHFAAVEARLQFLVNELHKADTATNGSIAKSIDVGELQQLSAEMNKMRAEIDLPSPLFVQKLVTLEERIESTRLRLANEASAARKRLESTARSLGPTLFLYDLEGKKHPMTLSDTQPFVFSISSDCGAAEVFALYFAGVLSMPVAIRKRLSGIAIGLPLLYVMNVLRLTTLGVLGLYADNSELFQFVHQYLWQGIYVIFAAGVWLVWLEAVSETRDSRK